MTRPRYKKIYLKTLNHEDLDNYTKKNNLCKKLQKKMKNINNSLSKYDRPT